MKEQILVSLEQDGIVTYRLIASENTIIEQSFKLGGGSSVQVFDRETFVKICKAVLSWDEKTNSSFATIDSQT